MRIILALALFAAPALAVPAVAQTMETAAAVEAGEALSALERWQADPLSVFDGAEVDLDAFKWLARPVVVFANTPADPAFQDQMALLLARQDVLAERDVVLIADTDPEARSDVRLQLRPRGFMLAILGKDGRVLLRKPLPWDVREITRTIDKSPERQRELDERALRR